MMVLVYIRLSDHYMQKLRVEIPTLTHCKLLLLLHLTLPSLPHPYAYTHGQDFKSVYN